jgi:hypothetical protein
LNSISAPYQPKLVLILLLIFRFLLDTPQGAVLLSVKPYRRPPVGCHRRTAKGGHTSKSSDTL